MAKYSNISHEDFFVGRLQIDKYKGWEFMLLFMRLNVRVILNLKYTKRPVNSLRSGSQSLFIADIKKSVMNIDILKDISPYTG